MLIVNVIVAYIIVIEVYKLLSY